MGAKNTWMWSLILAATMAPLSAAQSQVWVRVSDVSQLKFQTFPGGKIWFRNLRAFDGNALDSNYAYFIDTNTAEGKAVFALILTASAQNRGLWFGLPDNYAAGQVEYVGDW